MTAETKPSIPQKQESDDPNWGEYDTIFKFMRRAMIADFRDALEAFRGHPDGAGVLARWCEHWGRFWRKARAEFEGNLDDDGHWVGRPHEPKNPANRLTIRRARNNGKGATHRT
jgi:hypothetical protein